MKALSASDFGEGANRGSLRFGRCDYKGGALHSVVMGASSHCLFYFVPDLLFGPPRKALQFVWRFSRRPRPLASAALRKPVHEQV